MIHSITPFTLTDYPDKLACVAWFAGCNMRCVYCYNKSVVLGNGAISKGEFLEFLNSRVGKLNGVVLSGGECTINPEFLTLLREIKGLNFSVKVDTNGSNLKVLKRAISENLIDYIALDFKALKEDFKLITGSNLYSNFIETLKFLLSINFDFEVRTTIHSDFLGENEISKMAQILETHGYKNSYFLQNFLQTNENFGNLSNPKKQLDPKKIKSNLNIALRNF